MKLIDKNLNEVIYFLTLSSGAIKIFENLANKYLKNEKELSINEPLIKLINKLDKNEDLLKNKDDRLEFESLKLFILPILNTNFDNDLIYYYKTLEENKPKINL